MAHKAMLLIEKQAYYVVECEYEFVQPMNDNGQPAGSPSGSEIRFVVVSPDDGNLFLHEWMASETDHKDGYFSFAVVDQGKPTVKTLNFYRAFCIRLHEWIREMDEQMLTEITIYARTITFGEKDEVSFGDDLEK